MHHRKGFYSPQLDGLRFFAFLMVFLHHFLLFPTSSPIAKELAYCVKTFGWMGVDLFLVLSGFLISKLLIMEQESIGTVSVRKFFVRRALRIWPLYYLAIVMGFLIFPLLGLGGRPWGSPEHSALVDNHLIPYLFFLGNWSAGFRGYADGAWTSHLWTISLEEQFYIVWPLMIKVFGSSRNRLWTFLGLGLAFTLALRFLSVYFQMPYPFVWTVTLTRLDPLILGTALALLSFSKVDPLSPKKEIICFLSGVFILALMTLGGEVDGKSYNVVWQFLATATGFSLILWAAQYGTLLAKFFSWPLFRELGKITYGNYVFHLVVIGIVTVVWSKVFPGEVGPWAWLVQMIGALTICGVVAYISYRFFEKPFLVFKEKFAIIRSRPI